MSRLTAMLANQAFQYLLFAMALLAFCWPFLPSNSELRFVDRAASIYFAWLIIIVFLFLRARALKRVHHDDARSTGDE